MIYQGKREDYTDGGRFNYRGKNLSEVEPMLLVKSFGHQPRFILNDTAIWIFFYFVNLFIAYGFLVSWKSNQGPGIIVNKGLIFSLHCSKPLGLRQGLLNSVRFNMSKEQAWL